MIRIPPVEHSQRSQRAGPYRQEAEPLDARRQPVQVLVDDGKHPKGHIEDGVAQREVDAGRRYEQLGEEHADGAREDARDEVSEPELLRLVGGDERRVGVGPAELLGPADEDDRSRCFGEEEEEEEKGQAGVDEADPEAPAPADGRGAETGDDWSKDRTKKGGLEVCVSMLA